MGVVQPHSSSTEPPVAQLTTRGTILLTLPDWDDKIFVQEIPGRVWRGSDVMQRWELPCDEETIAELRRVLPLTQFDDSVSVYLSQTAEVRQHIERWRSCPAEHLPTYESLVNATLFEHQRRAVSVTWTLLTQKQGVGIWHEMGLGKSLTAITLVGAMKARNVLVACPASVIGVWSREVEKFAKYPARVVPLTGSTVKRAARVEASKIDGFEGTTFYVTNYDVLWREVLLRALLRLDVDVMICDEAHYLKTPRSKRSIAARKIAKNCKRIALTGTPVDTLHDWYGVMRWVDESIFGSSEAAFRARYFHQIILPDGITIPKHALPHMLPELTTKAHSVAHACSKAEALDLPDRLDENRYCELEPAARKIYRNLKQECIALLDSGEAVVGATTLTRILRLRQVTGGFVTPDNGDVQQVSKAKLKALKEAVDDVFTTQRKVVIFAEFTAEIDAIRDLLYSPGDRHVAVIDGRVPPGEKRDEIINDFQESEDEWALVVQTRAGGAGITLHSASTAIFYSLPSSNINYSQAKDRIHRIGQTQKCTYVHLLAEGSIDEIILEALQGKQELSKLTTFHWKQMLSEGA